MLLVFLILFLGTIQGVFTSEVLHGDTGDELEIDCKIKGEQCIFVSGRGSRICAGMDDLDCDNNNGIQIKKIGKVCRVIFSPIEDSHYGKWTCQDKSWYGTNEITRTVEIAPSLKISVELTEYFGDVYFRRGDGLDISCHVFVDSDQIYDEYPGNNLRWKVGNKMVQNSNPYLPVDENEWVQVLNYQPVMEDNHQRLSCFDNELIEGQVDGINLHMIDFMFKSETIYVDISEEMQESVLVEALFKSKPPPKKENIFWKIGDTKLHAGEISSLGLSSSEVEASSDSEYSMVSLSIPPDTNLDVEKLLREEHYLSVGLVKILEPFKVPIVFKKKEVAPPPVLQPDIQSPPPIARPPKKTVNKVIKASILGYILGGIVAFAFLACCIGYYIYKCCCGSDDDDTQHFHPPNSKIESLVPQNFKDPHTALQKGGSDENNHLLYSKTNDLSWKDLNGTIYTEHFNPSYSPKNIKSLEENADGISKGMKQSTPRDKSNFYVDFEKRTESMEEQTIADPRSPRLDLNCSTSIISSAPGNYQNGNQIYRDMKTFSKESDIVSSPSHSIEKSDSSHKHQIGNTSGNTVLDHYENGKQISAYDETLNLSNRGHLQQLRDTPTTNSDAQNYQKAAQIHEEMKTFSSDESHKTISSPLYIERADPGFQLNRSISSNSANESYQKNDQIRQDIRTFSDESNEGVHFSPWRSIEKSDSGNQEQHRVSLNNSAHESPRTDDQPYIKTTSYMPEQMKNLSPSYESNSSYQQFRDISKSSGGNITKYTKINEVKKPYNDSSSPGENTIYTSYTETSTLPRNKDLQGKNSGMEDSVEKSTITRKIGYMPNQDQFKMESNARIESIQQNSSRTVHQYTSHTSRHSDGGEIFTFKDVPQFLSPPKSRYGSGSTHSSYENVNKDPRI